VSESARTDSAVAAVVAAAEPSVREHAVRPTPTDRFGERLPPDSTRAFVVEAIYEGWLMHYGRPRAFERMDDDLRLLGGDALFALGLERLADEGDIDAVAELADLISLTARAVAEDHHELAEALWSATVDRLAGAESGGAAAAFARLAPREAPTASADPPTANAKPYP
jgi:hypothetical protein